MAALPYLAFVTSAIFFHVGRFWLRMLIPDCRSIVHSSTVGGSIGAISGCAVETPINPGPCQRHVMRP